MEEPLLLEYTALSSQLIAALERKQYGSEVLALTYLIQILVLINELYSRTRAAVPSIISSHIQSAMSYIDNHLHLNLSLGHIAGELNLDKYYLSHLFKQQTGGTIYRYVLLKRSRYPSSFCPPTTPCPIPATCPASMIMPISSAPSRTSRAFLQENTANKNGTAYPQRCRKMNDITRSLVVTAANIWTSGRCPIWIP